jgi:hypothetical protein
MQGYFGSIQTIVVGLTSTLVINLLKTYVSMAEKSGFLNRNCALLEESMKLSIVYLHTCDNNFLVRP